MTAPEPSLEAVIATHRDRVFRIALGVAGNVADAEDITQEALLAVARGLASFRGEASLGTWIYRVTLRAGIRWLGRNRRTDTTAREVEQTAAAPGLPLEVVEALGRLPLASRTILMLVAVEGFTHAEAARMLEIPEGTVASRLHTARAQLRHLLA